MADEPHAQPPDDGGEPSGSDAARLPPAGPDERSWAVDYRIRFDEAGPDGRVRPGVLLAYAQDCAWVHSTALGFDRAWYAERGLAWLVRAVRLDLLAPIPSGAVVRVRTEVVGFRGASARRRTEVALDGRQAAVVVTDWALTDASGRPARVPGELRARFAAAGSGPSSFAPLRAFERSTVPGAAVIGGLPERVRRADADPMGHLNNGRALDLVEEALATSPAGRALLDRLPRRYVIAYRVPLAGGRPVVVALRRLFVATVASAFAVDICPTQTAKTEAADAAIVAVVRAIDEDGGLSFD